MSGEPLYLILFLKKALVDLDKEHIDRDKMGQEKKRLYKGDKKKKEELSKVFEGKSRTDYKG